MQPGMTVIQVFRSSSLPPLCLPTGFIDRRFGLSRSTKYSLLLAICNGQRRGASDPLQAASIGPVACVEEARSYFLTSP